MRKVDRKTGHQGDRPGRILVYAIAFTDIGCVHTHGWTRSLHVHIDVRERSSDRESAHVHTNALLTPYAHPP